MISAETVKSHVRLVDALSLYGFSVDRTGFCSCPFHTERTPSMRVYPADDSFYCFGCGAHGDVIDLVKQLFGLSFKDAVEKLAADFGLIQEPSVISIHLAREAFLRRKERERTQKELDVLKSVFRASADWLRVTETATEIAAQFQHDDSDFSDGFAKILREREKARTNADDALNTLIEFENSLYKCKN